MRNHIFLSSLLQFLLLALTTVHAVNPRSIYTDRPGDPHAVYFTPDEFGIKADGSMDVSDALQEALNKAKRSELGGGILFVPEGTYKLSKTIYIPSTVRLIGYGSKRPLFVLGKNSPEFKEVTPETRRGKYVFWFIGGNYTPGRRVGDANAGTFYSSIINVDIRIENGNENAAAIRAHFAQHCSVSAVTIHVGSGLAGIVDAGNHIENLAVYGGEYGINTVKSSPGWPIMLLNTHFEGQRKAAIRTNEGGLTIVRAVIKNTPVAVEIPEGAPDRLFMENCIFENVRERGLIFSNAGYAATQINLRDIQCKNVPKFSLERATNTEVSGKGKTFKVSRFIYGFNQDNLVSEPEVVRVSELETINAITPLDYSDTPTLPSADQWVNIRDLGAKGDGFSDDTQIFKEAVEKYPNIYIPQGWYVVKEPLTLKTNTNIIGMHPGNTILLTLGGNPLFSGFGPPQAQLTTPQGELILFAVYFLMPTLITTGQ